jgi:hypothetical protein
MPRGDLYTGLLSLDSGSYGVLTWRSLNQLYYTNFISGSVQHTEYNKTGSFENYLESSFTSGSRYLQDSAVIYAIPKELIGTHIEPGSVVLGSTEAYLVDQNDYLVQDYFIGADYNYDDGEGRLFNSLSGEQVGNVIYSHGQIIITDPVLAAFYTDQSNTEQPIRWKSNQPIYTYNYNIKISDSEYNYTFNPTAQTGSTVLEYSGSYYLQPSGELADNVTGSYFQPYITTVGLYNDANELIAVAKLAQPLPKSANTETTIQVKLDI